MLGGFRAALDATTSGDSGDSADSVTNRAFLLFFTVLGEKLALSRDVFVDFLLPLVRITRFWNHFLTSIFQKRSQNLWFGVGGP